ncbi:hypothetical protein ACIP79_27885 [Streptomyces sp. NPDC088747]|uniref:hypothetical protein n=1 Tax=Streptomyces sp. NPDC088747 TaxID=3365886 RepID=UPI0038292F95
MDGLKQAFFKIDRQLGGAEPPPRAQVFLARNALGTAWLVGVGHGLLCALVLSAFDDPWRLFQAMLVGLGMGLFAWLACRFERRRQAHYERTGGFRGSPPKPPVPGGDRPPVWFEGMWWICLWATGAVLLWLLGQLKDPPYNWPTSLLFAGFFIIAGWPVRLVIEHRRRRGDRG